MSIHEQLQAWDRQTPIPGLMIPVDRGYTTECWEWTRTHRGGYGLFRINGVQFQVTRWILRIHERNWKDGHAGHLCDNTRCVRPDHLVIQTASENAIQRFDHGRHSMKGESNPRHKLTENDVIEIRSRLRWDGTRYQFTYLGQRNDLRVEFDVGPTAISNVAIGYTWPWTQ